MATLNRAITLTSRDGTPLKANVRVCMETYFREFFLGATLFKGNDKSEQFKAALQMIVWGGVYLESMVNFRLLAVMERITRRDEYSSELWNAVERNSIVDKLEMLGKLAKRPGIAIKAALKRMRFISDFRNRLVHYKDLPTPMDPKVAEAQFSEPLDTAPSTGIETALSEKMLRKFQKAVEILDTWLGWLTVDGPKNHWKKYVVNGQVVERRQPKPPKA
jgi:hypothetical protein